MLVSPDAKYLLAHAYCVHHGLWKALEQEQTSLLMAFFQNDFLFATLTECTINHCPIERFFQPNCGSLQLLQSYHGPLAASLINASFVRPINLGGWRCLGGFSVMQYSFCFQIMC
ncbi:hypothetical protein AMECASPLE_023102 [Ameca splendens]|uniref:Uncharacterized protein n=1 Tax=Ameca splendens TaxID=208324 RepID=A0ABV0Z205_9TELE